MSGGAHITVVGIGADGWAGLSERARAAIRSADEVIGSGRQLASLPAAESPPQRVWPVPLQPLLEEICARGDGQICVLASGDPLHYGIGATLVHRLGPAALSGGSTAGSTASSRLSFISQPSAFSLACARLGWPADRVELISTVGRPPSAVNRLLQPGRRIIVYVSGEHGAAQLAGRLVAQGFGASAFHVLEQLGGPHERVTATTAAGWGTATHDPLSCVAITVAPDGPHTAAYPVAPGLPDAAYASDGQLTKRHVRAATLAALAPAPGQLLWDIGAGSGSIAIEWLRLEPTARAIALEPDPARAARIGENATKLGVPELQVIADRAPEALHALSDSPDAVFIGGGLSSGVLEQAWERLAGGGRLVANAVTIESEQLLCAAHARHGGELVKLSVSHAEPLGAFTTWRPALPVVQWAARKPPPEPTP